ncbi:MAG: hypothetical protein EOP45_02550 [Sphingobacteriaceae bacterium]|nr:MAG: hypothetical protein EOP45_02550 [Sphingobacteriaceae bacterium]
MFKRISSNVNPDATVAKEIRKEFAPYFQSAEANRNRLLNTYPKQIFIAMVGLILLSGIVCFLVLTPSHRQKENKPDFFKGATNVTNDVTGGVGQIMDIGTKISDLNKLRKQVEEVLQKPNLSHTDTVFLERAIQQLEKSNKLNKAIK